MNVYQHTRVVIGEALISIQEQAEKEAGSCLRFLLCRWLTKGAYDITSACSEQ